MGEFRIDEDATLRGILGGPTEDDLDAIHDASMHVVENVGVRLAHDRAQALFEEHGATIEDDVVTVPRDVVEECIERVPSSFTLRARNPEHDVTVGKSGPPVRAPGYGPSNVLTFEDGRRQATLADYERFLKLAQVEDVVTCVGYHVCHPVDVTSGDEHVRMLERSLALTDKPIMGPTYGREQVRTCLEMVAIAVGDRDLGEPYVAGLVNTTPPRSIDTEMTEALVTYAEHGQPPIVSSLTMVGASGPESVAASMVQANAENLVGIALTQLVNPGTPVVYGVPSATIDARYGSLSVGSPESAQFVSFAGQMGRYYGLPSRAGGALTDSKTVDYQSGFESTFVQTVTAASGIDFVLNSVGTLESYSAISPEKFVLDCEALRCLDRFGGGVTIDEENLTLDRIEAVDPAGHFFDADRPSGAPETEFYRSEVADKRSYDDWMGTGGKSAFERGQERVREIVDAYERPALDEDVARELDEYVDGLTA